MKLWYIFLLSGSSTPIRHISLRSLIPNTDAFMTYEGSTTHPGCWESTVWIILNKPIYITKQEVSVSIIAILICRTNTNWRRKINSFHWNYQFSINFLAICITTINARFRTITKSSAWKQCEAIAIITPSNNSNKYRFQTVQGKCKW